MSVTVPNQTVAITRNDLPTPDFRRWQLAITDAVNTPIDSTPIEPITGDFLPLSTYVKGVDGIAFYGALATGGVSLGLETLADSGAGALLGITRDSFGRVSGTTDATITGTAGEIDVADGDAVAGPPTLSLADVTDAGGGTLQKTAFDAKGRKTGSSAATAADLPIADAGGYFTGTDVEAALQELGAGGGGGGFSFVGAGARNSGAVAVSGTTALIPLPTETYDTSGIYDPTTNKFTVPVGMDGMWRLSYSCVKTSGSGVLYLFVRKNGATDAQNIPGSAAGSSNMTYAFKALVVSLAAGDYLTLNCYSSGGGNIGSASDTGLATIMQVEYLG